MYWLPEDGYQIIFLFIFELDLEEEVNLIQIVLFYNLTFLAFAQTLV